MTSIRMKMEALLGEMSEKREQEEMEGEVEVNLKALAPQLVLAMQSMGLDPSEDEHIDAFMQSLKQLATNKSSLLKQTLKRWSSAKAAKSLKVAKAAI